MKKLKLFVPITKVEKTADDTRMVYGVLALEEVDKDNEVMDYDGSKKFFESWNSDYREKTKAMGVEESVGNLRSMHKTVSAGAFRDMAYDDDAKTITVAAEVVDSEEVKKVDKGVYTGFSIGARRVKAWLDSTLKAMRWIADPYEGSIVDNPCMYGATITAVKAAGAKDENAEAVKFVGAKVEKGMYGVSQFAQVCSSLMYLAGDAEAESQYEGDNSPIPAKIRACAKQLCSLLVEYTQEEVAEAGAALDEQAGESTAEVKAMKVETMEPGVRPKQTAKADEPGVRPPAAAPANTEEQKPASVEKARTPNKAALLEALANIKTQIESLEEQPAETATPEEPAAKAAGAQSIDVEKIKADVTAEVTKQFEGEIAKLNESLKAVLEMPVPTAVKVSGAAVVEKDCETDGATKVEEPKSATDAIKMIHAAGPRR